MITLNDIAPYPQSKDEATANSLLWHYAAAAFVHERDTHELSQAARRDGATAEDKRRAADARRELVARFGEVLLLRALVDTVAPGVADGIAKRLWSVLDDGSTIPELLWDWLAEYTDPEQVAEIARTP